jgi:transposase-like protein
VILFDLDRRQKGRSEMPQKRYKAEAIIGKLREAEVLSSQGMDVEEVCRRIEVTKNTYYRWRKEYGGLRVDQAHRLKILEQENGRLKKLVADQALDIQILREAASGN